MSEYICKLFRLQSLPFPLKKQAEDLKVKGYSYADQLMALKYFYELEGHDAPEKQTIGIIPYIMDEARMFINRISQANAHNKTHTIEAKESVVKINMEHWATVPGMFDMDNL